MTVGQFQEVDPEGVAAHVFDDHRSATVGGGATGPGRRPDGEAVDGLVVSIGQAGGGTVAEVDAVVVQEQDRSDGAGRLGLDRSR